MRNSRFYSRSTLDKLKVSLRNKTFINSKFNITGDEDEDYIRRHRFASNVRDEITEYLNGEYLLEREASEYFISEDYAIWELANLYFEGGLNELVPFDIYLSDEIIEAEITPDERKEAA